MRILVIEDEGQLADVIARGLRQAGLAVDTALDGEEGLEKASYIDYDIVILDRDLPLVHGDDVCRELVSFGYPAGILMLTASGGIDERVEGLMIGADDYLPKPFAMQELRARLHTLHRRRPIAAAPQLRAGDIILEPARRRVERGGKELHLTRKEFGVLEVLMAAGGQVVSAEELLERVWDEFADPFTNAVRVTIMTLRRKLGDPPVIETVVGVGYRIS